MSIAAQRCTTLIRILIQAQSQTQTTVSTLSLTAMADLTTLRRRRRRGVTKSSITKLGNKTADLEAVEHNHIVVSHAVQLLKRLDTYDADYRNHYMAIIDALESDEAAIPEQEELDRHDEDEDVTDLTVRSRLSLMDALWLYASWHNCRKNSLP